MVETKEKSRISDKAVGTLNTEIAKNCVILKEEFNDASEILQNTLETKLTNGYVAQMLLLLGGYELALENSLNVDELTHFGTVKEVDYKDKNTYEVRGTLKGLYLIMMLDELSKIYPNFEENDYSFFAHMGYTFLRRFKAGQVPFPSSKELELVLSGKVEKPLKATINKK